MTNWPTDRVAGWQIGWLAGCEETKVCPFLILFPLCIICRYLLDSQDQLLIETSWIWMDPEGQQKEFAI